MKPAVQKKIELRMSARQFDGIMRGALGVAPPPSEPKEKPANKKRTAAKKPAKVG